MSRKSKEEREREENRERVLKRERQWQVASNDEEEEQHQKDTDKVSGRSDNRHHDDILSDSDRISHHHRKKSSKKKDRKKSRSRGGDKHRSSRPRSRPYSDSDSDSYSSCSSSSSEERYRKRKKLSKRSKDKKRNKKYKKDRESKSSSIKNEFGKYGIIKESDFYRKQRDFEVWMAEVKGIAAFSGPKYELMNLFKEFCEDYNTATMPHEKYYNYEEWEMEEYQKQKMSAQTKGGAVSDEAKHLGEMRQKQEEKRKTELNMVLNSMSKEKIEEMKRQQLLKQEMTYAYKVGDDEKRAKIERRLAPEEKKQVTAHPWAR